LARRRNTWSAGPLLRARHVEQILDQDVHARDRTSDDIGEVQGMLRDRLGWLMPNQLRRDADRVERVAQVVRDDGEHLVARADGSFERLDKRALSTARATRLASRSTRRTSRGPYPSSRQPAALTSKYRPSGPARKMPSGALSTSSLRSSSLLRRDPAPHDT
jgi:hypothetical protein